MNHSVETAAAALAFFTSILKLGSGRWDDTSGALLAFRSGGTKVLHSFVLTTPKRSMS
jgi:hypothetical protein